MKSKAGSSTLLCSGRNDNWRRDVSQCVSPWMVTVKTWSLVVAAGEAEGGVSFVELVLGSGDHCGDREEAGGVEGGDTGLPGSGEHVGDFAEAVVDGVVKGIDF